MNKWQRGWLYLVIIYSTLHLVRDVSQDLGVRNILSTPFVKAHPTLTPVWFKYHTYPFEILMLLLSILLLRKNKFGYSGYLTFIATTVVFGGWMIYWKYL